MQENHAGRQIINSQNILAPNRVKVLHLAGPSALDEGPPGTRRDFGFHGSRSMTSLARAQGSDGWSQCLSCVLTDQVPPLSPTLRSVVCLTYRPHVPREAAATLHTPCDLQLLTAVAERRPPLKVYANLPLMPLPLSPPAPSAGTRFPSLRPPTRSPPLCLYTQLLRTATNPSSCSGKAVAPEARHEEEALSVVPVAAAHPVVPPPWGGSRKRRSSRGRVGHPGWVAWLLGGAPEGRGGGVSGSCTATKRACWEEVECLSTGVEKVRCCPTGR